MPTPPDCILRLNEQGALVLEADWATAPEEGWRPRMFPNLIVPPNAALAGFVGMVHLRDLRAGSGLRVWVRGTAVTLGLEDTEAGWVWTHAGKRLGPLERVGLLDVLSDVQRTSIGMPRP